MPLYKPTELAEFLNSLGIAPKKGLSQNFLIDGNIIRKILQAAEVKAGDLVLEIGPGPGALSEALLAQGVTLLAVEKDRILAQALERLRTEQNELEVFCDDILEFPMERLVRYVEGGRRIKVIANLPYHLTTPILIRLLPVRELFASLTVMVQDEVAKRMTALPGTKAYGSLTLFLNFHAKTRYSFPVSSRCFYPVPKVESAVVTLELCESPAVSDQNKLFQLTRTAFCHRRKMLRASLKELYPPSVIVEALHSLQLPQETRPEELSLEQFIALCEALPSPLPI